MKNFFIMAVAAIAVLSSCSGDDIVSDQNASNVDSPVFTATIEGEANTRTTISEGTYYYNKKVNWESTDKVSINGAVYTVTPGSEDATTATLTKKSGETTPTGPFKAYYPSTMYSEGKAILPAEYKYADGKFNMPMYAESSDTQLSFKNLCAVLAIKVPSTEISSVLTVEVYSDQQLNGEFTATPAGVLTFTQSQPVVEANKKVTLKFDVAKTISDSETFYVPIPAGDHKPLTI